MQKQHVLLELYYYSSGIKKCWKINVGLRNKDLQIMKCKTLRFLAFFNTLYLDGTFKHHLSKFNVKFDFSTNKGRLHFSDKLICSTILRRHSERVKAKYFWYY